MEQTKQPKERQNFSLPKSTIDRLQSMIAPRKRSEFVARAIETLLREEAKRRAIEALDNLPSYPSRGKDSTETLRELRKERLDQLVSRHSPKKS